MAAFNPIPMLLPLAAETLLSSVTQSGGASALAQESQAALRRQQALEADIRQTKAAGESAGVQQTLARTTEDLTADLARAQASERARQAAAGVAGGASGTALLTSLGAAADSDYTRAREDAQARLKDIRQGLDSARRQDLLALAEDRRRGELARLQTSLENRRQWSSALFQSPATSTSPRMIRFTDMFGESLGIRRL